MQWEAKVSLCSRVMMCIFELVIGFLLLDLKILKLIPLKALSFLCTPSYKWLILCHFCVTHPPHLLYLLMYSWSPPVQLSKKHACDPPKSSYPRDWNYIVLKPVVSFYNNTFNEIIVELIFLCVVDHSQLDVKHSSAKKSKKLMIILINKLGIWMSSRT